jgi:hypothetical protein
MTTHSKPYPRVTALIDTFADWLKLGETAAR